MLRFYVHNKLLVCAQNNMRLDSYLAEFWPEYSRSQWHKYCKEGRVTVNGEVCIVPNTKLGEDDEVKVAIPEKADFSKQTIPIIYEDDDVIVLNKPSGLLTHAKGALSNEFSVAEFVRPYSDYGKDGNRPGIIHRLDRDTSGVILCVKNDAAAKMLQRQFSDRKVKKRYLAIVEGEPKQPIAVIDLPIARNPKKPSTFRVDANGKLAQTKYEVLAVNKTQSLVRLTPHTGRTHQLRVHMSHIGNPIVGDRVYGKEADRLLLHAQSLEITLPNKERKVFSSPVPQDFFTLFPDSKKLV